MVWLKGCCSIIYLRPISQNDLSTLSPLHVPMEKHDNIMEEKNIIESIEFER